MFMFDQGDSVLREQVLLASLVATLTRIESLAAAHLLRVSSSSVGKSRIQSLIFEVSFHQDEFACMSIRAGRNHGNPLQFSPH